MQSTTNSYNFVHACNIILAVSNLLLIFIADFSLRSKFRDHLITTEYNYNQLGKVMQQ